jgi:putative protease
MKNIELLAPAGSMNNLRTALRYGADAVYVGGRDFGLRAMAANFDDAELAEAVKMVHALGKKIYVTINIFARNSDLEPIKNYAITLEKLGVDAVIVSDLGVLKIIRENTSLEIHISTQANTLNKLAAEQLVHFGASRIILARECSLTDIHEIATYLKGRAEIEVFIHGAMCVSYSGRCLLSSVMVGRNREANRGACAQPCRFKYHLMEEKRDGEYYPIDTDANGTYIMNSRDLCLADHLNELSKAGVTSFKIEGRTKSEYYVAGVVNTYRRLMDEQKFDYRVELGKISHRSYTTGFLFDNEENTIYPESSAPRASYEFVGVAREGGVVEQRNNFRVGDTLEILSPSDLFNKTFTLTKIINSQNEEVQCAKLVQEHVQIECPYDLQVGDILRKKLS